MRYIIGIDEAGRGPIAGPVAVGGAHIAQEHHGATLNELLERFMRGKLKDSKKLSEKKREEIFLWMQEHEYITYAVSMGSSLSIDEKGIVPTIGKAMSRVLTTLAKDKKSETWIKLDGSLKAPDAFKHQETITKGDENEMVISLASIAAKVTRDRYMKKINSLYPHYNFAQHKGYGTKAHYEALKEHGLCEEHRKSWIKL